MTQGEGRRVQQLYVGANCHLPGGPGAEEPGACTVPLLAVCTHCLFKRLS